MPFRYDRTRRRLWIDCSHLDISELRPLIQQAHREGLLPEKLDSILCQTPAATFILRGPNLGRWLDGNSLLPANQPHLDALYHR